MSVTALSPQFIGQIDDVVDAFCASGREQLIAIDADLAPVADVAARACRGGKRVRPAFCYWGYRAIAQPDDEPALLRAAASLEFLHASALVHDDLIDASDTRRGEPATHKVFESWHRDGGWRGDSDEYGRAMAILVGDLLLMWSAELFDGCGLQVSSSARALMAAMRTEVTAGQFLDVSAAVRPIDDAEATRIAEHVVEYKTTRYTVRRPLQIGAALAGATSAQQEHLASFATPTGRLFQYRDDLLGVFGDPMSTGKPAGDDLREGKRTVLIAEAFATLGAQEAKVLRHSLGQRNLSEEQVDDLRAILIKCGAQERVEAKIAADVDAALAALNAAGFDEESTAALTGLVNAAAYRSS